MIKASVSDSFSISVSLVNDDGTMGSGTVTYDVRNASDDTVLSPTITGSMSASATSGLYYKTITILTEGDYRVYFTCPTYPSSSEDIIITSEESDITSIIAKTNLIPADPATETNVNANESKIDTLTSAVVALQTDLGDPSTGGTTIYAEALAIKGFVDDLETRLSALRAGYLDNLSAGAVALNSTVAKESTLAPLTNITYGLSALQALLDAIDTSTELASRFDEIKGVGWATETLKAIKDSGLSGVDLGAIADAVWDEAISGHITATTFGGKNQKVVPSETLNDYKADVSSLAIEANVVTHVTTALNTYDPPTRTEATSDKTAIIAEIDANEAKLDSIMATIAAPGTGNTAVNHNTGGVDNLRYTTTLGAGIDDATIVGYLKTDYDAGSVTSGFVKGKAATESDGRWVAPMYLDTGFTYTIVFYKESEYGPNTKEITI